MWKRAVVWVLCAASSLALANIPAGTAEQRERFLAAEQALERGDLQTFERLRGQLADYPLLPYLDYARLNRSLDQAGRTSIEAFLGTYSDTPLAPRLRARWLQRLAARGDWTAYLDAYRGESSSELRCHYLRALISTGRRDEALPQVADVWLHGRSQPKACDPVFAEWTRAGGRTDELSWQRIALAMEAREWRLARYLARPLAESERRWVERWIRLYNNPRSLDDLRDLETHHPYRTTMIVQALRRLARWDGEEALARWRELKTRFPFDADQVRETEQYIVRNLVRVPSAEAYAFIRGVEMRPGDIEPQHARIRAALLREDWPQGIAWVTALPQEEREQASWQYWLARALEGEGRRAEAWAVYRRAAGERAYYGFMAADRIDADYHLEHNETPASPAVIGRVAGIAGIARARELFALERWVDARREWRDATAAMDPVELKAAAKLAEQDGWYDRAIFTLARTGFWDDLELRFPLEHAPLVEQNAERQGIDVAWVFAVMRQESAFMHNARSHAGARGLMQLMPATARKVATGVLKQKAPRGPELYEPALNIALGSAYLKQVKSELGGSTVLATAAYNAGPHRVTRWLPQQTLPADIWIELVPFAETRGYLQRVLAYTVIYEKRMGREPVRLRERLHPVPTSISLVEEGGEPVSAGSAG